MTITFDLDAFVSAADTTVIDHYRWLRDRSPEQERHALHQRMETAKPKLNESLNRR